MRKTLIAVLALTLALAATPALRLGAQITHNAQGATDATATALLNKAAEKLKSVSLTVTMTALDSQKKPLSTQRAQVSYRNGKYRMVAADQEIVCNGTDVWHINKSAREVTVSPVPPDDDMNLLNPSAMMANYNKNFRAKYIRTDDDGTAIVDLQPRTARSFHKLRLAIDEKSGRLKRLEVHKYDSSREVYEFSNHSHAPAASTYRYDAAAHAGMELIDMR